MTARILRIVCAAVVACTISITTRAASAGPVLSIGFWTTYGDAFLNSEAGSTSAPFAQPIMPGVDFSTPNGLFYGAGGEIVLAFGPLQAFTTDDLSCLAVFYCFSTYTFAGSGTVAANFSYSLTDDYHGGVPGAFTATLGEIQMHADTMSGSINAPIPLLDVAMDDALRQAWGIPPGTLSGDVWLFMDFNEWDFGQPIRYARTFGQLDLEVQDAPPVPEPALLVLFGLGFAAAARRLAARRS